VNQGNDKTTPQSKDDFSVDVFRPEDAEGIAQLFRTVYGEGYPFRLFYDPQALTAANAEGRYYSIVARLSSGKVIGVAHLYRSVPYASLYEWGVGLVLREYRNVGVNNRIAGFLHNNLVPRTPNIEELFGEAVCNHTHIQKASFLLGYVETAIEVALMPAEAYTKEKSAAGRVATLDGFRCYVPKPHRIFLPAVYETMLRRIYGRLDDKRDMAVADGVFPAGKATIATLSVFDFTQVARIAVPASGADFTDCLSDLENKARKQKAIVFQVFLNLTEPWVGETVDKLRSQGYFFSGALPRWFDGDGLLMQKLDCFPDFEGIALLSDFSKELLAFIQMDWSSTLVDLLDFSNVNIHDLQTR